MMPKRWSYTKEKVCKNLLVIFGQQLLVVIWLLAGASSVLLTRGLSIFDQFTWLDNYWCMIVKVFYKYFSIDCSCISNNIIVIDLAQKTRSLAFHVDNRTNTCVCCPFRFGPTLWDTAMSLGSIGRSTFMSWQTSSTAASASSWFGSLVYQPPRGCPCCSRSFSLVGFNWMVFLRALMSLSFPLSCS